MKIYPILFFLSASFLISATQAFNRKPKNLAETSGYTSGNTTYQSGPSDYDHAYESGNDPSGSSSEMMRALARSASDGAGRLRESGSYCYRSVKQIIADGLGKNLGCIRKTLDGVPAQDAGSDLVNLGFRNDMNKCRTPGVVRVYKGVRSRTNKRSSAGDKYGHIEVLGDDAEYHSFYSRTQSIEMYMPGRRILTGCYVPDENKVASGPASKCASVERKRERRAHNGTHHQPRTRKSSSRQGAK